MALKQILRWIVWLLVCVHLNALAAIDSDYSQFLERLSPNEGLSQSHVTKIAQDQQGYLWFGTQMGLNRYDGYKIKHISGPNGVFEVESISSLFVDQQGYIWVSTMFSGLYRVDPYTFESEQFFSGKHQESDDYYSEVIDIIQQSQDEFILAISNGVYRLNINNRKFTNLMLLETKDDIIRDMLLVDNNLFAASSDGLYHIDLISGESQILPHKPEGISSEDSDNTKRLVRDEKLGLLVGTVAGLYQIPMSQDFNKPIGKPNTLISELNIWDMIADGNQYLVATDKGLFEFSPFRKKLDSVVQFSRSRYLTKDDNIKDIHRDNSNNIWLASRSLGVMKWSAVTKRYDHISASTNPALSNENVWSLHQDLKGDILVGTDNGLNRYDHVKEQVTSYLVNSDLKNVGGLQYIEKIFADKEDHNRLWLSTGDGTYRLNKTTGELERPYLNEASSRLLEKYWMFGMFVNDNRNIFFYNLDGYYHYNSETGNLTPLEKLNETFDLDLTLSFLGQLPNRPNTTLLSLSGHLYEYDLSSQQIQLVYKVQNYQPQTFDSVDNWLIDGQGTLWLAVTGEGLVGIDSQTFEEKFRFNTSNQLTTNHIYSLQMDAYQNIWFSSQSGVFRLNLNNMHIENFSANDGLMSAEFNYSAFTKLHDNRLAFGSPNGVTFVSPDLFQKASLEPRNFDVVLTGASLLSSNSELSPTSFNQSYELEYDAYGLKLSFSTLQFDQQNKTRYNYRLSGPSPLNIQSIRSNELLLSKLPAGKYRFQVTAINPVTGFESEPLELKINANHAPWASPIAKLIYIVVVLSIAIAFYISRQRRNTMLLLAHKKVKDSRNQMQLALHGSNSGIWDYHIETDELFQERLYKDLGHPQEQPIGLKKHVRLINQAQFKQLEPMWLDFIAGKLETWDASYQIQSASGEWFWYRDIGKVISRNIEGKPIRVTGTYTNITQTKANEARALLFGEAFSQINDWVLILDGNKTPMTANDAFMNAFGLDMHNAELSLSLLLNRLGNQKNQEFNEILDSLQPKHSWQGEETIQTVSAEQHPVLIKITAIANNQNEVSHYVVVLSDITIQKSAEEKLRHLAHYDYLTDLPNRKLVMEKIESKLDAHDNPFALFFIDLDRFKQVNDLYGHLVGDNLLKQVASILVRCVNHNDIVARQSGDEFILLVDEFRSLDQLGHLAQKINELLAQPLVIEDHHLSITSSIGISIFPSDADSANELIKKADLAMIHAKRQGRGEFQLYTQDLNDKAHRRLTLENELRLACENKEFANFYQPIINHTTNNLVGVELLMRWPKGDTMVSPGVFIPVAEEIGLISQMTIDAIDSALTDYGRWQSVHPDLYISINLSPVHILQEGLSTTLKSLLSKHNLPAKVLRLEITEGTLLADLDIAIRRLNELRIHGFKLLLDDFGTGYSSMTYLSKFPVDYLKIDKSFTLNLEQETNRSIIKSIVNLADNLNLQCIVEGVETEQQLACVAGFGCQLIQGFYFAKPMPLEQLLEFSLKQDISSRNKIVGTKQP